MNGFSPRVLDVVRAFSADLGLSAKAGPDGSYTFVFSHWGTLSFTSSEDGARVLVSLARTPHVMADVAAERRLLNAAGMDPTTNELLHAGLAPDGSHVLVTSIEDRRFDLVSLGAALDRLVAAHENSA